MIDGLLKLKKISPKEHKLFQLFNTELGHEVLADMMDESFMEEPLEEQMNGVIFAFYDGRRSLLRSIRATLDKINKLRMMEHDGTDTTG